MTPLKRNRCLESIDACKANALIEHRFGIGMLITPEKRPCSREEFWIHAESMRVESRLAAVCSLRGQGERRNRIRVPRLWDQRSHSDNPPRTAETATLPSRRRDHQAVLTIDGFLQWNRYKAGLRSNHPYIAHRSSRYRPMPIWLAGRRFRGVPCRVAQSTTCTGRRVHRPYPPRRLVHPVPIPAMESVLPAKPGPIQQMS